MILPTYPGKVPQTSPNPHKKRNSFRNWWWRVRGIFEGYVGEILSHWFGYFPCFFIFDSSLFVNGPFGFDLKKSDPFSEANEIYQIHRFSPKTAQLIGFKEDPATHQPSTVATNPLPSTIHPVLDPKPTSKRHSTWQSGDWKKKANLSFRVSIFKTHKKHGIYRKCIDLVIVIVTMTILWPWFYHTNCMHAYHIHMCSTYTFIHGYTNTIL